jgi:hypothetical protein
MRQTFTALVLGLATFTSAAVHAEQRIDATGFEMTSRESGFAFDNISLLSDVGGTTRIAVNGFNVATGYRLWEISSHYYGQFPAESVNWEYALFDFNVRDGYRITSMTFTGTLTGELEVGVPPFGGTTGEANNQYTLNWGFSQGDQSIPMGQQTVKDLNGDQQLQLNANLPFTGNFQMYISSEGSLSAQSGVSYWYDGDDAEGFNYYDSHASLNWHDAVLTVQVSPVPEPSTWGMLLAGVALLGVAARRAPARARTSAPG